MRKYLFPYNMGSQGAKELANAMGIKRIKREKSKFRGSLNKIVINWGNAKLPDQVAACHILNKPEAVKDAGCKLSTFDKLHTNNLIGENAIINIPDWTHQAEIAKEWLDEGATVVARTVLRGHSGEGIVLIGKDDEWVDAPLYVKYVPKKQEYRVHVFQDAILDQQRKARKKEVADEDVNWKVRNLDGGFIFAREGVDLPEKALEQAKLAVKALGLDFGAVDIIWNQKEDKYYVIEVNTAPGLTGTTLEKYTEAFNGI